MVPLLDLPDAFSRVAAVALRCDRPQRVVRLDDVRPRRPRAAGGTREDDPRHQEDERQTDHAYEHMYAYYCERMFVSSGQSNQLGNELLRVDFELQHRSGGRAAAFRGASGVENPAVAVQRHLRQVRMAVDDGVAIREHRHQALRSSVKPPRNVDHADPRTSNLDHSALGEELVESGLIHVPDHACDRPEPLELSERLDGDEVAPVKDQLGFLERTHALVGEPAGTPRQVRVGDDRDLHAGDRDPSRASTASTIFPLPNRTGSSAGNPVSASTSAIAALPAASSTSRVFSAIATTGEGRAINAIRSCSSTSSDNRGIGNCGSSLTN